MFEGDEPDLSPSAKENDDLFLDLIKQRPCLYDKTLKEYHDKVFVETAMEEIAFIMQDSVESCEKKWKEFKQAYTREKNLQELESRSGSGASTRKKWIYFERMKELFSSNGSRQSYSNISEPKEVDKKPFLRPINRKRKAANPVEVTLNKIQSTITSVMQSANDESNAVAIKNDDVDVLTGRMIRARLNQMSPRTAKNKRKRIMKCLIDSDSDEE